jgi:hypothetical protein
MMTRKPKANSLDLSHRTLATSQSDLTERQIIGNKIVCSGQLIQYRLGGHSWQYLQYLVGLRCLSHEVTYFDNFGWPNSSCYGPLLRSRARRHSIRLPRRQRGGDLRGHRSRQRPRVHRRPTPRLRERGRRARHEPLGRRVPAHRLGPRFPEGRLHPRRGHELRQYQKTETVIMEAIERLMRGCTAFMITHRLGTLANRDLRLEIEGGQVARFEQRTPAGEWQHQSKEIS